MPEKCTQKHETRSYVFQLLIWGGGLFCFNESFISCHITDLKHNRRLLCISQLVRTGHLGTT